MKHSIALSVSTFLYGQGRAIKTSQVLILQRKLRATSRSIFGLINRCKKFWVIKLVDSLRSMALLISS